jgi:ABC-type nickel/cobalt efflux system permease component RcnA
MRETSEVLLIFGAILLIGGGAVTVLLFSMSNGYVYNGVPYVLNESGYQMLFLAAGGALTGLVLIIIAVAVNRNEPQQEAFFRPVAQQSFVCRVCGAQVGVNQKYCHNCGRILEW